MSAIGGSTTGAGGFTTSVEISGTSRPWLLSEDTFTWRSAMFFEVLLVSEMVSCLLLIAIGVHTLAELPETPEVELGQRAWAAARFSMVEARELGPLFKHLVRASRHGLRLAHEMQESIRSERIVQEPSGLFAPLLSLWRRRQLQRSAELADLAHLVEQLEHMGAILARYRAGVGRLIELHLPLSCLDAETSARRLQQAGGH